MIKRLPLNVLCTFDVGPVRRLVKQYCQTCYMYKHLSLLEGWSSIYLERLHSLINVIPVRRYTFESVHKKGQTILKNSFCMYITQIPSDLQAVHTSHLHVTYHVVSQEEHTTDGLHWLSVHQLQLLVALICQILTLTCLVDVAQGYFVIRFPICVDVLNRFFLKIRKKHKYHFISYDTIICPGRAHVHWWFPIY